MEILIRILEPDEKKFLEIREITDQGDEGLGRAGNTLIRQHEHESEV